MHLHGLRHSSKVSCLPQICLDGQGWKCRKCHPQPQYPRPLYHVFEAWDYPKCYWTVSPVQKGIWSRGHFLRRGRLSFSRFSVETDLSFSTHVKAVTKSAYYHLKNIARVRCFVSSQDLEKLVHAFITSWVDYCNGLLTGLISVGSSQLEIPRVHSKQGKFEFKPWPWHWEISFRLNWTMWDCSTLLRRGRRTWTPALRPVPRLEGQVRM